MPPSEQSDKEILIDENLRQKFLEILKSNGIKDEVDSITMKEPAALKGQHMASSSVYVEIKFKDVSIKPKNLFVKKYHEDGAGHSTMLDDTGMMKKEAEFFTQFLPEAKEFCKKYPGCENFLDFFPKCYHGDDKIVVLENLVLDSSFVMIPKEDFQDKDTAKMVLTNLAKFHATTSSMLEELRKDKFENKYKLTSKDVLQSGPMKEIFVNMLDNGINTTLKILKENPVEGSDFAFDVLNEKKGKGSKLYESAVKTYPGEDKFLCLNHGDCWNNNLLFKRDSITGKVNDHKFVDLQITRLGSVCYDLTYYIYLSVKPEIRPCIPELLQHYFENFTKFRAAFGKDSPFTFKELVNDFKRRNGFGVYFRLVAGYSIEAMNYVDVKKMGDNAGDMATLLLEGVQKWLLENPSIGKTISEETVIRIREYRSEGL